MNDFVNNLITRTAEWLSPVVALQGFDVSAIAAITLVCLACGMVGSLVVGNRMAFFSDAMAHTAFAGVATGLIGILIIAKPTTPHEAGRYLWIVPLVTVIVGVLVGSAMEFVRERTGLTNDTVIGVFFAASVGFAVTVYPSVTAMTGVKPEDCLFGSLLFVTPMELILLFALVLTVATVVVWRYNAIVFGIISPPLARSRGISLRFGNYLFIILLALVVNLSIKAVGVLLINALLIVPAAAAMNVAGNARQMFRCTLVFCLLSGWLGYIVSMYVTVPIGRDKPLELAPGGTIVLTAVSLFFATMIIGAVRRRFGFDKPRHSHAPGDPAHAGCCGV